jgi:3-hydroxyisobutyrate dehydrogenase
MSAKISILGLGIMGAAMARNAARGGFNTTVWDRSPERASSFASDKDAYILASGDQCRVGATAQPFFDAIAVQIRRLGDVGQGTRMKLLFNAWIAASWKGRGSVYTWRCTPDRPGPFRVTGLRRPPGSGVGSG